MNMDQFFLLTETDLAQLKESGMKAAYEIMKKRDPDKVDFRAMMLKQVISSRTARCYELQVAIYIDTRTNEYYLRWYEYDTTD